MTVPVENPPVWGSAQELAPIEALMWRLDTDPRRRSTLMLVEVLDRAPAWERLVAAHEWASGVVPRMRDRVVEPFGVLGSSVWARDPQFDLRYHVRRLRVPGDGGWPELLELAEQVAMTPFDRARPPWEAILVEGLPDGRAAYLFKIHHVVTDGLGMVQLMSRLHSRQREPSPEKGSPDTAVAGPDGGLLAQAARQLGRDIGVVPAAARTGGSLLRGLRRPGQLLHEAANYAASAQRVLGQPPASGSPLLAARGGSWRFVALELPFADLRAAAKAAGGTVNDAYLAALLGGFRMYHEQMGHPFPAAGTMPVSMPVSVRTDADNSGGNRFAPARLAGPVGIVDPRDRIIEVGKLMRAARSEPALESADHVMPLLARLPSAWTAKLAGGLTAGNDLQASNVPGIREEVFLAGARIERVFGFAPLPGCASMITMTSHGHLCCVAANLDAAAITDPDLFARSLEQGFREVLSLHPGAGAPRRLA
jgi:diacylglycerol O-acyltransferase / wax synthase